MKIEFFVKNFECNPQIKNKIEGKINKLARFSERILRVRVELVFKPQFKGEKNFKVEIKLEVPGNDLYAASYGKNLLLALDEVLKKIKHKLLAYKEKLIERRK